MSEVHPSLVPPRLFIAGASARSAAFSALRAGIEPLCADLFADEDLRAVAQVVPVPAYPDGLAQAAATLPAAPWMYVGGMENHPDIIQDISAHRELLGIPPAALAKVRDPFALGDALRARNLPVLAVRTSDDPPPRDGTWLCKALHGAGGTGVAVWGDHVEQSRLAAPHYFQRRVIGDSFSALYVAGRDADERNTTVFVGVTRQLIGEPAFHTRPFQYCGSLGPLIFPAPAMRELAAIGEGIAEFADLRGLFGCDFIFDDGHFWLAEVNPRYTASHEVYERAWNVPLLAWHCAACRDACSSDDCRALEQQLYAARRRQTGIVGKAILFAAKSVTIADWKPDRWLTQPPWEANVADLPAPGSRITSRHPICTVFANAADVPQTLLQLQSAADDVLEELTATEGDTTAV